MAVGVVLAFVVLGICACKSKAADNGDEPGQPAPGGDISGLRGTTATATLPLEWEAAVAAPPPPSTDPPAWLLLDADADADADELCADSDVNMRRFFTCACKRHGLTYASLAHAARQNAAAHD